MSEVVCEYKDKCISHPNLCQTCQRNKGKRNYYVPEPYPFYPWYPWYPWQPFYPYWQPTTKVDQSSNFYQPTQ